jgi:hypothetical protein
MKPTRENVLGLIYVTRLLFDGPSKVAGFYTVCETQDGKQHLVGIRALAGRVEILPHSVEVEHLIGNSPSL